MAVIIIFGHQRTGKTLHSDRFAKHYGCSRVYDDQHPRGRQNNARDGDLILSTEPSYMLAKRYPAALLIPINDARLAVGLEPAPAKGFALPEKNAVGDPRVKTAVGPTILLRSGHYFDLLDPASSRFVVGDIAHALGKTCRFAGQCTRFYSVAEHSWHASFLVSDEYKLAALMHDAAEAFIGDVTRPLKRLLPEYRAIEKRIETVIDDRFMLAGECSGEEVKAADVQLLAAEQAQLMPAHADTWAVLAGVRPAPIVIRFWSPEEAALAWLMRFATLTGLGSVDDLERLGAR
jgi:hypothetical protein